MVLIYLANNPYRKNDIYHHGIKGQRWGVRRFQNPDGTLTAEGKRRYTDETAKRDAQRYSDAHATYGVGSRTRMNLIDREISEKKKNDPYYEEAFEKSMKNVDSRKSIRRAKNLDRKSSKFIRGKNLYEQGKTASSLILDGARNLRSVGITAFLMGGGYYEKSIANNLMAGMGLKTVSDISSLRYYQKNRAF